MHGVVTGLCGMALNRVQDSIAGTCRTRYVWDARPLGLREFALVDHVADTESQQRLKNYDVPTNGAGVEPHLRIFRNQCS